MSLVGSGSGRSGSVERPLIVPRLPSYRAPATTSLTLQTVIPRSHSSSRLVALNPTTDEDPQASYRAWRKDSQERLALQHPHSRRSSASKGKGKQQPPQAGLDKDSSRGKATTFVVGAPSSGSGDEGDAENGTTGAETEDLSDDDDGDNNPRSLRRRTDANELGVEDIIRWQVRQPVQTVDSLDLDSLLPLGIGDYSFVIASRPRSSRPPSPAPSSPSPAQSPSTTPTPTTSPAASTTLALPPPPNRVSLGKGKFSEVLLVRKGSVEYALKHTQLHPHHPLIATRLLREPTILAQLLPHPNLVKVFETIRTPGHFYLVEENLRESVTLEHLVASYPGGVLPAELAWTVLEQLASVVRSLHVPLRVCHRDIKPENILVRVVPNSDDPTHGTPTLILKLLDFGLATHYSASEPKLTTCCGSPAYHSPELWRSLREPSGTVKYWGPEVDIWCLGLTLLRCLTPNKYPLGIAHSSLFALSDKVVDALLTVQDEPMRRTLAGLMQMDGEKRMRAFERYCAGLEDQQQQQPGLEYKDKEHAAQQQQKKEFKSTTFLPTEKRHSLDLPLVGQPRRSNPARHSTTDSTSSSIASPILEQQPQQPQSRSPSRSRQRQRNFATSLSLDLQHTTTIAEMTPPSSALPSPDLAPLPLPPFTPPTTDSLPSTPRPYSRERSTLPLPIELVLLNPTDEPIRRSASYIKYALRCAGILYHVRESDSDSAFSLPGSTSSGEQDDNESSFVCHLQCVMRLPADPTSKASSALIAALRPPISRAHSLGTPVRSSSTPPVGASKSGAAKKKESVKALTFFLSIRKAPSASELAMQPLQPGSTHFSTTTSRSVSRTPRPPSSPSPTTPTLPTSGKRRHAHSHSTPGDRVIVALSDSRALAAVRDALRTDLDPAASATVPPLEDVQEKRGRTVRPPAATGPLPTHTADVRATSGSRDARNRRSRVESASAGLGVIIPEKSGGGGGAGFFDFAFGRFSGLGSRANSGTESTPTTPVERNEREGGSGGERERTTPTASQVRIDEERSRAMAAAYC